MKDDLIKEALKLRFEYYNVYSSNEEKWHKKYRDNKLYHLVVKSFDYDFKDIAEMMPRLIDDNK